MTWQLVGQANFQTTCRTVQNEEWHFTGLESGDILYGEIFHPQARRQAKIGGGGVNEFQREDIVRGAALDSGVKYLRPLNAIEDESLLALANTMIHIGLRYGYAEDWK